MKLDYLLQYFYAGFFFFFQHFAIRKKVINNCYLLVYKINIFYIFQLVPANIFSAVLMSFSHLNCYSTPCACCYIYQCTDCISLKGKLSSTFLVRKKIDVDTNFFFPILISQIMIKNTLITTPLAWFRIGQDWDYGFLFCIIRKGTPCMFAHSSA